MDGFLVSSGSLYGVSRSIDGRISALVSDNNGASWNDYASGWTIDPNRVTYAIGGARHSTPDGYLIGTYADYLPGEADNRVLVRLVKIRAGVPR